MSGCVMASLIPERTPPQLSFTEIEEVDYYDLCPAGLVRFNEAFASDTGQLASTGTNQGTVTISGGVCTVVQAAGLARSNYVVEGAAHAMPQMWAQIDVVSRTGSGRIGVGFILDATHFVVARFENSGNTLAIRTIHAGVSVDATLFSVSFSTAPPFKLALSVNGNSVCAWVDTGSGFTVVTSGNLSTGTSGALNLRRDVSWPSSGWKAGFTLTNISNAACTVVLDNFKVGYFGGVGMRDQAIVLNEDGTPAVDSGKLLFLATTNDPRGSGSCGAFTLDLTSWAIVQTGVIQVLRSSIVQSDLSGNMIRYNNGDQRLLLSTWGNGFGAALEVEHKLQAAGTDLLVGANIITMTELTLPEQPGAGSGRYDPFVVRDTANSRWLLAYTCTEDTSFTGDPFYTCLAHSTDMTSWTAIADDSGNQAYEGTKIVRAAARFWTTAGGGSDARIYDDAGVYVGDLDAVIDGDGVTFPHPMVFPYGRKQYLMTFDGDMTGAVTFTWGDVRISSAPRYR